MASVPGTGDAPVEPPWFVQPLQGIVAVEGGSACFEAIVAGLPTPEVRWYHGNNDVTASHNYEVTYGTDGRTALHINEVFDEDAGQFTCQAANDLGQASSTAQLLVETTTVPPDFTERLVNVEAKQGETVRFQIKAHGVPTPRIKWYREGAEIRNSDDFQIRSEDGMYSLTIAEAYEEDTGRFTVTASNQGGKATSTAVLTVSGEGSVSSRRSTGHGDLDEVSKRQFRMSSTSEIDEMSALHDSRAFHMQRSSFVREEQAYGRSSDRERSPTKKTPPTSPKVGARSILKQPRQKSPSPIRSVRMSPPTMRRSSSDRSNSPMKKVHSVKAPSPTRRVTTPTQQDFDAQKAAMDMMAKHKTSEEDEKRYSSPGSLRKGIAVFPPFIKTGMRDIEVIEGETSVMKCEIMGNPTPAVNWFREGAHIESSRDFEITYDGRVTCLIIRETFIDDAGTFTCTATNEAGSTSSTCFLKVKLPHQMKADKTERTASVSETELSMTDYDGFESTEAELDFVSGVSEAELTDTEMFKPTVAPVAHLGVESKEAGFAASLLSPVAEEASTPSGKGSQVTGEQPKVYASGEPPRFVSTPASMMKLVEGSTVKLECVISGSPPPRVTWARNGMMLQTGYRFKVLEDKKNNLYSLIIGMVFAEDVGEYTITATNQFGFISGSVMLMSEDNYKRFEEQEALDRQAAAGVMTQDSDMQVGQGRLPPRGRGESRGRGERRAMIPSPTVPRSPGDLRRTTPSPVKRFREVSRSPVRTVSPSTRLSEVETLDIEKFFKPTFLRKPDSRECNEGATTRIDCKLTGRPMPDVTFYQNGSPVLEDYSHRVVVKEDGIRSLIISPVKPEDSGEYTIVAENIAGRAISTLLLTVLPREGVERPRIIEKPQSVSVKEGDLVRLEVFAVGRPTPEIVWLKDNALLIPEKHPDIRIEGVDGHGLLTIENASKSYHDAWYTATAVNKGGRDLTRCKVNVERSEAAPEPDKRLYIPKAKKLAPAVEQPSERVDTRKLEAFDETDLYCSTTMQKPRFKKKLASQKQKILGSVHFECHIVPIGDPTMKVEWFLDGKPLEYANRIMEVFEFGYAALDISAVYPRDTGVISCRATNAHGQVQTSCTLIVKEERGLVEGTQLHDTAMLEKIKSTEKQRQEMSLIHDSHLEDDEEVKSPPKIVLPPEPVRVQEGEPARFRCRIVGSPAPKVDWYLNGQAIRPSKRFRIWFDGIHYFEIATVRGYDHGEVKMVAQNKLGREEFDTKIEVFQAQDFRSVLQKGEATDKTAGQGKVDTATLRQYRITRTIEEKFKEEKGKHMVSLKEVEKPIAGLKKLKKVDRAEELQEKFTKLAEEERMLKSLEADKRKAQKRDREYESFIRKTKDDLMHWEKPREPEKSQLPWLERPRQSLPPAFQTKVEVTPDMEAPVVLERMRNLTIEVGEDARFRVRYHGKPEPDISWYRNEMKLEKSDRVGWYFPEDRVCEFFMRNATSDDSGSISVRLSNPAGQAGSQGFLLVQEPIYSLYFSEPLYDVSAKENDRSAVFECRLSSATSAVQWRHRLSANQTEEVLHEGVKYKLRSEGAQHFLRICDVKATDEGEYSCVAADSNGAEVVSTARLSVTAVPRSILSGLKDQIVREGGLCQFTVQVSHNEVSGTWFKGGVQLQPSSKFAMEAVGSKRSLSISDVRSSDQGTYEYRYNGCSSSASLLVQGMNVSIVKKLKDQKVFSGNTVTLEVKLSRNDAVGTWTHNEKVVTSSERMTITSDLNMHTLVIERCQRDDAGKYAFTVGGSSTTANLSVTDVNVIDRLENVSTLETNSATFSCQVDQSNYKGGMWFHNGKQLGSDTQKHEIETSGKVQRLTVKDVNASDGGVYAYVTGSDSVTEATLDVTPVRIVEPLRDVVDAETTSVQFSVVVSHPSVLGKWYKNGHPIEENNNRSLTVKDTTHFLTINSLTVDDQGTYEFRASGQSSSANLVVQGAQITCPLSDVVAMETDTVVLECQVAREGVQGTWMKNGKRIDQTTSKHCASFSDGLFQRLRLSEVTKNDSGTYTFQFGRASTSAKLSITEIKFSKGLRNITVAEGADALFQVEVANRELRDVRWEKNGAIMVDDGSKYTMKSEPPFFSLTVHNACKPDEAAYSCVAGSAKTIARLYIETVQIMRKLTDVRSIEQRTFEMVTEVSNSSMQGTWTKDGSTIQSSERVRTTQHRKFHKLIVDNSTPADSGTYSFKVGRAVTTAQVSVEPVHLTAKMKDAVVKETQTATFECEVSHPDVPVALCSWKKNGTPLKPGNNVFFTIDGRIHRLTIHQCSAEDRGSYEFKAGKDKCSARLDVKAVLVVKPLPKTMKATSHETAVLECDVDAPGINAFWTKDGQRLDANNERAFKYEITSHDVTHRLKVKDLTSTDAGIYTFMAGSTRSSTTLFVEVLSVEITKAVKNVEVIENKQAVLEFKVNKPNVTAKWYKNGIQVDFMMQKRLKYEVDDLTHRLVVDKVSFGDTGEYIFQAENQRSTAYLYVQPPEAPNFVQELRNCIVIAGETAKFTVRTTGRPRPEIKWYKEGVSILPSFKYKLLHEEDQYTLAVLGVEPTDAGEYTCVATNEVGSFRSTARLQVDSKEIMPVRQSPPLIAPAIVEVMQDFITREGQSARFQCKIAGADPIVVWSRDGKRIKPSQYFKISEYNGVHQLEITEAYPEDEGVYSVTASNAYGEATCSASLKLDIEPPRILEPLQPAHVIEGSAVKMDCVIEGTQMQVRWYKRGHDITEDERYKWKLDRKSGYCWLVIPNCAVKDSGEIRCHVSNVAGEAVCSTDLLVSEKSELDEQRKKYLSEMELQLHQPAINYEISFPVEDVETEFSPMVAEAAKAITVPDGEEARFQVRLASMPEPEIAWYKDGELIGPRGGPRTPKYRFYYETRAHSHTRGIVISPVSKEDIGRYELRAWNKLGQVTSGATLNVRGKARLRYAERRCG